MGNKIPERSPPDYREKSKKEGRAFPRRYQSRGSPGGASHRDLRDRSHAAGVLVAVAAAQSRPRDRLAVRVVPRAWRSGAISRRDRPGQGRSGAGAVYAGAGDERAADDGGWSAALHVAPAGGAAARARITATEAWRPPPPPPPPKG